MKESFLDDTDPQAKAYIIKKLQLMSPQEKIKKIFRLSSTLRQLMQEGIRQEYPGIDSIELKKRFCARLYGRDLSMRLFNWDPEIQGW